MRCIALALILTGCAGSDPEPKPNRFDARAPIDCLNATDCNRVMVVAHRGLKTNAAENTIAAFEDAIAAGVDGIEIDVRHTADDRIVIMHDDTVDRTTDGTGLVSSMTLAQIQALVVEQPEGVNRENGDYVPTFEEVLALAKGSVWIDVDLKTSRADLVAQVLTSAGQGNEVVIHTSSDAEIAMLHAVDPALRIMPNAADPAELATLDAALDLWIVETEANLAQEVPEGLVEAAHAAGIKVFHDMLGLPDLLASQGDTDAWLDRTRTGIDVIQTDRPDLLLPFLDQEGYR